MRPLLFDSSLYISVLRGAESSIQAVRDLDPSAPMWLSGVVLEELYAGAGPRDRGAVERLEQQFKKARRIVVPSLADWSQSGKILARLAAKYGYETIGRGRLTNDALIATSAGRLGITVLTANARDFAKLAEFFSFSWSIL